MECQALRRSRLGAVELLPVLGRGVHEILHTGRRRVGGRGDRALPAHHAAESDASYVCASRTHKRSVSPQQPIFSAMEQIVAHCVGCASCCSCTPPAPLARGPSG
jgi:hypothetical protein